MSDSMDKVQAFAEDHAQDAIRRHADRARPAGRETCENADCGEPISELRRANGAQLCLECQSAEEAQAAHFRTWRGNR